MQPRKCTQETSHLTPLVIGLEPADGPALPVEVQVVGRLVRRLDLHEHGALVLSRPLVLVQQRVRDHDVDPFVVWSGRGAASNRGIARFVAHAGGRRLLGVVVLVGGGLRRPRFLFDLLWNRLSGGLGLTLPSRSHLIGDNNFVLRLGRLGGHCLLFDLFWGRLSGVLRFALPRRRRIRDDDFVL